MRPRSTPTPQGDVTGANARIRTGVEKRTPEEIEGIALRNFADGSKAGCRRRGADPCRRRQRNRSYFVGDNPAMSIRVDRSNLGDAIKIQRSVEDVVAEMQASLPEGVTVELIRTRAQAITDRLDILIDNGWWVWAWWFVCCFCS